MPISDRSGMSTLAGNCGRSRRTTGRYPRAHPRARWWVCKDKHLQCYPAARAGALAGSPVTARLCAWHGPARPAAAVCAPKSLLFRWQRPARAQVDKPRQGTRQAADQRGGGRFIRTKGRWPYNIRPSQPHGARVIPLPMKVRNGHVPFCEKIRRRIFRVRISRE